MLADVLAGLSSSRKTLPSKYFYDKRGSELFERICTLEEYYLPKAEVSIMRAHIDDISKRVGTGITLIELGSGNSSKTRLLLDHLDRIETYYPVDISRDFLDESAGRLKTEYPNLDIVPVKADYTRPFQLPGRPSGGKKMIYYPGSTIGNFTPVEAERFLKQVAEIAGPNGGLLIGVDLKKDRALLEAAYNDREGVTAAFNKNILARLNRELGADFELDRFEHKAFYNEQEGRVEMHLVSLVDQDVEICGRRFLFKKNETIHTENSYKYTLKEFEELASGHFEVDKVWTDAEDLFSIQFLTPL